MPRSAVARSRRRRGNPALKPRAARRRMTGLPRFARNDGSEAGVMPRPVVARSRRRRGNPALKPRAARRHMTGLPRFARNDEAEG